MSLVQCLCRPRGGAHEVMATRSLRRCSLNQADERDMQLDGRSAGAGNCDRPSVFSGFLDVPWRSPVALRGCPVIAMAPQKLDQVLAVNSWKRWIVVSAVVLAMTAALASQTTPRPDRLTEELTSGPVVTLSGTVHPLTRRASDLGEANRGMRLETMTLSIAPSVAEKAELDALVEAQQNPKSAQYHHWLTQGEFGARFGLTEADLTQVTGWMETQGFTVKSVAPSRNRITFSGTVAQAESAFHTQIHQYRIGSDTYQ